MIFYTADLHLGYFPILHDTARPFTGVPEMDEALISNWTPASAQTTAYTSSATSPTTAARPRRSISPA